MRRSFDFNLMVNTVLVSDRLVKLISIEDFQNFSSRLCMNMRSFSLINISHDDFVKFIKSEDYPMSFQADAETYGISDT